MKKKKIIIGLIICVLSIGTLIFWEMAGREMLMNEDVLVAAKEINAGDEITSASLDIKSIPKELLVSGALTIKNGKIVEVKTGNEISLNAKIAKQDIPRNSQVVANYIYNDEFYINENESIFVIPSTWIASKSSSLRRGDIVEFWMEGASYKVGEYKVAFVKNESETEITNVDEQEYADPLDRTNPTSVSTHLEIICTIAEYRALYEIATGNEYNSNAKDAEKFVANKFLLVQTGE